MATPGVSADSGPFLLDVPVSGPVDADVVERVPVVAVQRGGSLPPLVALRTWTREVPNFQRLARHLGPDQPLLTLSPPQGERREDLPSRVEDWVEHFLPSLRRLQPHGPYLLGGWSFGGLVALSMAERLVAEGEQVALVAFFDTRHPKHQSWNNRTLLHEAVYHFSEALDAPQGQRLAYCRLQLGRLWRRESARLRTAARGLGVRAGRVVGASIAEPKRLQPMPILMRSVRCSFMKYAPVQSALPVAQLWTRESCEREGDALLGWSRYLRGPIECAGVAGSHRTLFDEPHVAGLAAELEKALRRARERARLAAPSAPRRRASSAA